MSTKAYVLRTTNKNGIAHGGFQWPMEIGATVTAPDWNSEAVCGGGLHGLLDGVGNYSLLSEKHDALWWVVEVDRDKCVWIDGDKVKFESCQVVYFGNMAQAMTIVSDALIQIALSKSGGDDVQAASGNFSQLAASGDFSRLAASGHFPQLAASGNSSQLAASGHSSQFAASGNSSQLAASGDYSRLAASGNFSRLAASGNSSQLAASGDYSRLAASGDSSIAMSAGIDSSASVGKNGCIALSWWDDDAKRFRVAVGYEGEDIKEGVVYVVHDGRLTEAAA